MANVRITMHPAAINELLRSPTGPVHRAVSSVVRKTAAIATATAPVDEGRLRNSHVPSVVDEGVRLRGRVENTVDYSLAVHNGTGIYGPKAAPIKPKRAKYLVFRGQDGSLVFAKQVKGMPGRPWLVDALKAASPWPVTVHPK